MATDRRLSAPAVVGDSFCQTKEIKEFDETRDLLGEAVGLQLRDLLLRFPSAVVEGVRWSALCKAYRERFPDAPDPSTTPMHSSTGASIRAWLADVAECSDDFMEGGGEVWFRLRDAVALTPGATGQLACWPLLVQRLAEIVRNHGAPQPPEVQQYLQETGPVSGVLLAQLKPLLRRHWDPAFEERAVGYYNEHGNHVNIKKMKHLIAELVKWRTRRLALNRCSAVDAELTANLSLVTSQRHNDMVLCVPVLFYAAPPMAPMANRIIDPMIDSSPAKIFFAHSDWNTNETGVSTLKTRTMSEAQRLDVSEREVQRLKIENAELKKRLRFGAEFLNKEIRRLRIENAELKKRCFPSAQQMQQPAVWVPVLAAPGQGPTMMAAPMGGTPMGGTPMGGAPPVVQTPPAVMGGGSGTVSPHLEQAMSPSASNEHFTPTASGNFVYGMMPMNQPWGQVGQMVAMPMQGPYVAAAMSPSGSCSSDKQGLLPQDLLSGGHTTQSQTEFHSQVASESVSPEMRPMPGPSLKMHYMQPVQNIDDRWEAIPQGIVEGRRSQFEEQGGLPFRAPPDQEQGEKTDSDDDEAPLYRTRSAPSS